jgi:protocatechuate 4,5-dioxygenase beta chain
MATLAAVVGVPHRPSFPGDVAASPGKLAAERWYARVREHLEAAAPTVLVEVANDHFTNFSHRTAPPFCLGLVDRASGPERRTAPMPSYTVRGHPELARAFHIFALQDGFDLASAEALVLDHSMLVPLHFLTPAMELPIVPLWVNGMIAPTPTPARCLALGGALRRFVDGWRGDARVAVVASGSWALEVGGPKMGWTDEEWAATVGSCVARGAFDELARRATPERLAAAGNASTELLNWLVAAGCLGDGVRPGFLETEQGDGFAAWTVDAR